MDRFLLISGGLLLGAYFAYWHDGFYLGPRFIYPLAPVLALWAARLPGLVRERFGRGPAYRATTFAYLAAGGIGVAVVLPIRVAQYRAEFPTMRWSADSAAAAHGISGALVLVRESWGAQLAARMWALGISRTDAELLAGKVDACVLDQALTSMETDSAAMTPGAARADLLPLLRDSARVIASPFSPDSSERFLPGSRYPRRCLDRINDDRAGSTLLPPLLLAHGGGNVYRRDLHQRNRLLLAEYPDRPVYLLRQAPDPGALPVFYPASRDSIARDTLP